MPPETWLETGPDHVQFMAAKRQRLSGLPPQFYRAMPESRAAQAELRDAAVAHLLAQHTEHFIRSGDMLDDRIDGSRHDLADTVPLALLGRIIEEDFILFQTIDGQDLITAACNAYTSSGRIVHRRCGDRLWIRSERQTFMRLPRTMALAFGIHTYSDPLSALADDRESLAALHKLLGDYTEERLSYSAMLGLRDPVRRWIEDRLAVADS
ncbi:MAG: DUF3445 domain-containing protein [Alphaproteobacteria bacterium]|nr:DUF3445 domain-containing protein [Alphaproteobacteria bacterium]